MRNLFKQTSRRFSGWDNRVPRLQKRTWHPMLSLNSQVISVEVAGFRPDDFTEG
jgi:hypothetical protein